MRNLYILLFASVLLLCCKKNKNDDDTGNMAGEFSYAITCEPTISVLPNSTYNFPFSIKVLSGDIMQNPLTCSLDGIPGAVSVAPSSMIVGQLKSGIFIFNIGNISVGSYPFTLKVFSEKYGTQSKAVVLKIIGPTDFAPLLAGSYDACYDYCPDTGFIHYASQVTTVTDTPYLLKISNVKNMGAGFVVRAWVSKVVTIPVQTISGKTIWGSGTFNQDARPGHKGQYLMAIKDTIASGVDTQVCTIHIEH